MDAGCRGIYPPNVDSTIQPSYWELVGNAAYNPYIPCKYIYMYTYTCICSKSLFPTNPQYAIAAMRPKGKPSQVLHPEPETQSPESKRLLQQFPRKHLGPCLRHLGTWTSAMPAVKTRQMIEARTISSRLVGQKPPNTLIVARS